MIAPLHTDQLKLLARALRQPSFRFIIIGYDLPDIWRELSAWLRENLPDRPQLELRVTDRTFQEIQQLLNKADNNLVLIPDFDWLFQPDNADVRIAFNQNRDLFARRNMTLLCFIQSLNFRLLPLTMPDLWSLRSLELEFQGTLHRQTFNPETIDQSERTLISIFAVLPAEPIAQTTLEELLPENPGLEATLQSLFKEGFIQFDEKHHSFTCDAKVQETIRQQHGARMFEDIKPLISTLIDKLEYEPGTGHLKQSSYESGALYVRYGESILQSMQQPANSTKH